MTTRGFKEADVARTAEAITMVLNHPGDETWSNRAKSIVKELTDAHPLYNRVIDSY
jgi:glycine/serine hydroxymethyltransferase